MLILNFSHLLTAEQQAQLRGTSNRQFVSTMLYC